SIRRDWRRLRLKTPRFPQRKAAGCHLSRRAKMIIDDYIETIGRYILQQRNARKPTRVPALKVFEWAQLLRYLEIQRGYTC
ncbi:hypothetical protein, partial [Serratia entomophila]|uniref:hypothetical protein n=1 Tax=Serratia entomophila TaxID=42906 RepID=UPI0021BAC38A